MSEYECEWVWMWECERCDCGLGQTAALCVYLFQEIGQSCTVVQVKATQKNRNEHVWACVSAWVPCTLVHVLCAWCACANVSRCALTYWLTSKISTSAGSIISKYGSADNPLCAGWMPQSNYKHQKDVRQPIIASDAYHDSLSLVFQKNAGSAHLASGTNRHNFQDVVISWASFSLGHAWCWSDAWTWLAQHKIPPSRTRVHACIPQTKHRWPPWRVHLFGREKEAMLLAHPLDFQWQPSLQCRMGNCWFQPVYTNWTVCALQLLSYWCIIERDTHTCTCHPRTLTHTHAHRNCGWWCSSC